MANNTMNFGIDLLPTTNDTFSLGSNDKKWIINGVTNPKLTDTTYSIASQSSNGLMSSDDKIKLDNISSGATANTGTVTSITTGIGLIGGTITENGTIKIKLKSETALLNDSVAAAETSGRIYPIVTDKSGYLAVNVPWTWRNISDSVSSTSSDVSASSKAVKTAYDLASGALPKTGGTMTGSLNINNSHGIALISLVNESNGIHGLKSSGYGEYDGSSTNSIEDEQWLIYRDIDGNIKLNGNASSATKATKDADENIISSTYLKLTGGTLTGTLTVKNNTTSCEARLDSNDTGTHGVLSNGYWNGSSYVNDRKWIAYRGINGDIYLKGTADKATQDSDGNTISSTYLKLSGGTMTGDLILKNNTTSVIAQFSNNESGTHGVLSQGYWNGSSYVQDRKWIAYRVSNGNIYLNGESASAEKVKSNVGELSFKVGYIFANYSVDQTKNYIQLPLSCERYIVISAWLYDSDTICLPGVYNNSAKSWYIYCYNTSNFSKHNLYDGDKIFYTYIDSGSVQFNNEIPIQ